MVLSDGFGTFASAEEGAALPPVTHASHTATNLPRGGGGLTLCSGLLTGLALWRCAVVLALRWLATETCALAPASPWPGEVLRLREAAHLLKGAMRVVDEGSECCDATLKDATTAGAKQQTNLEHGG